MDPPTKQNLIKTEVLWSKNWFSCLNCHLLHHRANKFAKQKCPLRSSIRVTPLQSFGGKRGMKKFRIASSSLPVCSQASFKQQGYILTPCSKLLALIPKDRPLHRKEICTRSSSDPLHLCPHPLPHPLQRTIFHVPAKPGPAKAGIYHCWSLLPALPAWATFINWISCLHNCVLLLGKGRPDSQSLLLVLYSLT